MAKDQFVLGSKRTMPKHGEGNTSPKTEAVSVEEVEVHHQELRYYDEPSH